ncbi:MAG: hypothetical protein PHI23_00100 [Candidatus Peribacteraceae bacterium]|nr:hypothetical protein [Candidatus Peribacteraceae bacterium]
MKTLPLALSAALLALSFTAPALAADSDSSGTGSTLPVTSPVDEDLQRFEDECRSRFNFGQGDLQGQGALLFKIRECVNQLQQEKRTAEKREKERERLRLREEREAVRRANISARMRHGFEASAERNALRLRGQGRSTTQSRDPKVYLKIRRSLRSTQ